MRKMRKYVDEHTFNEAWKNFKSNFNKPLWYTNEMKYFKRKKRYSKGRGSEKELF